MNTESWNALVASDIAREVGRAVASMRIAINLTQAELAEKSGISTPTVREVEQGRTNPSLQVLVALLKALGRLEDLQMVFTPGLSPLQLATGTQDSPRKRVRARNKNNTTARTDLEKTWTWGDENK